MDGRTRGRYNRPAGFRIVRKHIIVWTARSSLFFTLLVALALAFPGAANAAGQEFWDTYTFVEPYGGGQFDGAGNASDFWKGGVRLGRVGWLTGWEGDLAVDPGQSGTGDRYQASLDGFLKPVETRYMSILVLVGLGVTHLRGGPDSDDSALFHYRYGLAYRVRFSERVGLRFDVTALRSRAGNFSSSEATLGWVIYF